MQRYIKAQKTAGDYDWVLQVDRIHNLLKAWNISDVKSGGLRYCEKGKLASFTEPQKGPRAVLIGSYIRDHGTSEPS